MKHLRPFDLHARPGPWLRRLLAVAPFLLAVGVYVIASEARLAANPDDKLLPSFAQMGEASWRMATVPDRRSGELLLWVDTWASLRRIFIGVFAGATVGLFLGLHTAVFPVLRHLGTSFLIFLSIVPPLTLLPILFIAFGVGEASKIMLIFIGTVFVIARDIQLAVALMPPQQITKALTLGAGALGVVWRVLLPQLMPRLINSTRLVLGAAWLFLIAAEMIAATEGLGYRIGLARRYLAMDVIIPYVFWITVLGITMDRLLRQTVARFYPWFEPDRS